MIATALEMIDLAGPKASESVTAPQRTLEESSAIDAAVAAERAAAELAAKREAERVASLSPEDLAAEAGEC